MDANDVYKQLSSKMGLANSISMTNIWKMLCNDSEAEIANMLPGTAEDISAKTGKNIEDIKAILQSLFKKGVVFKSQKDGTTQFRLAKQVVQFHDSSILWEGATQEFFDLWKKVMDEDFTGLMKGMPDTFKLPSFMRVIPIYEKIETRNEVLTYEECARLIEASEQVAVVKCPCRLSQKNCDAPIEACIQINRGAEYVIDRGHGRKISKQEAIEILKKAEEAGLVHMTENRVSGNAICNCCSCCCEMFRLMKFSGKTWLVSPSRYLAAVNDACTACGSCLDVCPVDAISMNDVAVVNADLCMGCGVCATVCPVDAITLGQVRPAEHIPKK